MKEILECRLKVKELLLGKMELNTRELGKIIRLMAWGNVYGQMEESIKVNG